MTQIRVSYNEHTSSRCRRCMERNSKRTPIILVSFGMELVSDGMWCLACYEVMRSHEKIKKHLKLPTISRLTLQTRYVGEPRTIATTNIPQSLIKEWMVEVVATHSGQEVG